MTVPFDNNDQKKTRIKSMLESYSKKKRETNRDPNGEIGLF